MGLNTTKYPNNSRIVSGTPDLFQDDVVLLCDTSSAPVIINLLEIPDNYWNTNWKLYIVDNSNNAGTNNITINAGAGQLINNSASLTISTNNGYSIVRISGNDRFVAELSNQTASPSALIVQNDSVVKTNPTSVMNFSSDFDVSGSGTTANIQLYDTGWVDLEGFGHLTTKPQVRRIGKRLFFRGQVIVPLSSSNTGSPLIPMTVGTNTVGAYYVNDPYPFTYSGAGGCLINSDGSITFNNNNSIFPVGFPIGAGLDNSYQTGWVIASRIVASSVANTGVALSSLFNVVITPSGRLVIVTYKDLELSPNIPDSSNGFGLGHARLLVSKVKSGQYVPDWRFANSGVDYTHSSNVNTGFTRDWDISAATNTYTFDCDASLAEQIGGFQINIDRLSGFIAPPP